MMSKEYSSLEAIIDDAKRCECLNLASVKQALQYNNYYGRFDEVFQDVLMSRLSAQYNQEKAELLPTQDTSMELARDKLKQLIADKKQNRNKK
jgi:hypothetical protein